MNFLLLRRLLLLIFFFRSALSSQVYLSVSPSIVSKSGDSVLIKWSGVDSPSSLDWLGIYSPPDSRKDHFIGYVFLSTSPTYLSSGSGSISLPVINLRSNYTFRIFRWSESEIDQSHHDHDHNPLPKTKHLLASSPVIGFASGSGPEQVHLAFTDNEDEMRVMFVAEDYEERSVMYGEKEDHLDHSAVARVKRYEKEDMCDEPANSTLGWRDPGWIHNAVMQNLKNGSRYYYKVGNDLHGWSRVYSFVSRDRASDETVAFLFGDMGTAAPYTTFHRTQPESKSTIKWILRDIKALGDKPSFVSHIGDISYARGYSWVWDNFFNQIEPIAAKVPYHVCIGNHEYDWPNQPWKPEWASYGTDGGGECGVPYSLRFTMPGNSSEPTGTRSPATRNLYYSFNVGSVHFVYFSTETNFLTGSAQHDFLKHDLESVNRKVTPFVVILGHRPLYTTSHEIRDAAMREKLMEHIEPLLVKNKVNIAFWGHVHRYERFCPIKNLTCGPSKDNGSIGVFPVHIVIGMAGQDWQPVWEPRPTHPDDPVFPQPARSLYRGGEFGYTRLVATKEKLTVYYVGNHDGEVHDKVEILRSGEVLRTDVAELKSVRTDVAKLKSVRTESSSSTVSWFVKAASVLVLGIFTGYVLGYVTHAKREATKQTWTPVKTDDSSGL